MAPLTPLERLGQLEIELRGSGDSIYKRLGELEIAYRPLVNLQSQILGIERRLDLVEQRLSRTKENEELRRWADFLNNFPGGARGIWVGLIGLIGAIDLILDAVGIQTLINHFLGR